MVKKQKNSLSFIFHETILWALGSLFLATTGSPLMIVVNIIRFAANFAISFHQTRAGGAKASKITPYFSQLAVAAFNALMSVLEVFGVVMGTATAAEALYRCKIYTLNSCFYLSAGINDTKYAHVVGNTSPIARILLNPNVWMGPITFISFSYAFTPLIKQWGNLPYTAIPILTASLIILSLSISIQAIIQSYRLSTGFVQRNYGMLMQTIVNLLAAAFTFSQHNASWQFGAYIGLWAIGNIAYLLRNRKAPDYLQERKEQLSLKQRLGSAHCFPMAAINCIKQT